MSIFRFAILLLASWASLEQGWAQSGPKAFGRLFFPGEGNIRLEEGTYEILLELNYDPLKEHKQAYFAPMSFLMVRDFPKGIEGEPRNLMIFRHKTTFRTRGQANEILEAALGDGDSRISLSLGGELPRPALEVPLRELNLKKGDRVHLALTWQYDGKAYQRRIFLNGRQIASGRGGSTDQLVIGEQPEIWIGSPTYGSAYGSVIGIRISSQARNETALSNAAEKFSLERDDSTLLLEDFSTLAPGSKGRQALSSGGFVDGAYEVIEREGRTAVRLNNHNETN